MIRDHQRPHRDSWSFETKDSAASWALARPLIAKNIPHSPLAPSELDPAGPTPTLPERIVVRHGSLVPSWLDDQRLRAKPSPRSSPLAQRSSTYLVPSPGTAKALPAEGGDRPVLYIRTQMVPQRGREGSPGGSEGLSTMMFPESVRMSEVSVDGVVSGMFSGMGVSEGERVLFPIEESPPLPPPPSPPPPPPQPPLVANPVSLFAPPIVPLAVLRQIKPRPSPSRQVTASTTKAILPSPSVYSGPNSSLGHDQPPPPRPPRQSGAKTKVPQVITAFDSSSSHSATSTTKPTPPSSEESPTLPEVGPRRVQARPSGPRPISLQATAPSPDVVLLIRNKRPPPTPLIQHHLSVRSLSAEVERDSAGSVGSLLSLSRFPSPPPLPQGLKGPPSEDRTVSGSVVTEGGFEFEIMPSRQVRGINTEAGRAREAGVGLGGQALDVTSFVLGDTPMSIEAERNLQYEIAEQQLRSMPSVDSSPTLDAPAPARMSEFLIQQARATFVPGVAGVAQALRPSDPSSTGNALRNAPPRQSANLVVEAQGRQIPPRPGFLARTLAGYVAASPPHPPAPAPGPPPRSGLPFQPQPRPRQGSVSPPGSDSASSGSLLDSYVSKEETPASSVQGVPFRMFEQPRTPPLHLIPEDSDAGEGAGEGEDVVESVEDGSKPGPVREGKGWRGGMRGLI